MCLSPRGLGVVRLQLPPPHLWSPAGRQPLARLPRPCCPAPPLGARAVFLAAPPWERARLPPPVGATRVLTPPPPPPSVRCLTCCGGTLLPSGFSRRPWLPPRCVRGGPALGASSLCRPLLRPPSPRIRGAAPLGPSTLPTLASRLSVFSMILARPPSSGRPARPSGLLRPASSIKRAASSPARWGCRRLRPPSPARLVRGASSPRGATDLCARAWSTPFLRSLRTSSPPSLTLLSCSLLLRRALPSSPL